MGDQRREVVREQGREAGAAEQTQVFPEVTVSHAAAGHGARDPFPARILVLAIAHEQIDQIGEFVDARIAGHRCAQGMHTRQQREGTGKVAVEQAAAVGFVQSQHATGRAQRPTPGQRDGAGQGAGFRQVGVGRTPKQQEMQPAAGQGGAVGREAVHQGASIGACV